MEGFAGKVCVITGAGSGIGQALAIELSSVMLTVSEKLAAEEAARLTAAA